MHKLVLLKVAAFRIYNCAMNIVLNMCCGLDTRDFSTSVLRDFDLEFDCKVPRDAFHFREDLEISVAPMMQKSHSKKFGYCNSKSC